MMSCISTVFDGFPGGYQWRVPFQWPVKSRGNAGKGLSWAREIPARVVVNKINTRMLRII
jgi:hypothetical protein